MSPVLSRFTGIIISLIVAGGLFFPGNVAHASTTPRADFWITNGPVYSTLFDQSTLYIGGDFTYVGPSTGSGVAINSTNGTVDSNFPKINGHINVVIQNGAGGWYIGGSFTKVGGVNRNNLAFIQADMTVGDWDPDVSGGEVRAMVLSGSILYVGGDFTTIDSAGRNRLAALDITTTTAGTYTTAWDPDVADNAVRAMVLSGTTLYVGGDFTTIDSAGRNRLAALDITTTTAGTYTTAWDPDVADNAVRTMVLSGSILYVGGDFTTIDSTGRNRLAVLDTTTTTAGTYTTTWDPDVADNAVRTMVLSGSILYVGGDFTTIDSTGRNRLAALDTTSTTTGTYTTSWDPDADGVVNALAFASPATMYIGGDFTTLDGVARNRLAAVFTTAITAGSYTLSWNPSAGGAVNALVRVTTTVVAGGDFFSVGGQSRNHLAAFGIQVGTVNSFNPDVNDIVRTMAVTNNSTTLYIGGDFTSVTSQTRNHLAAVDATTGTVTSWDPDADDVVRDIKLSNDETTLYVAGDFTTFNPGANIRQYIAAIDTATGTPTPWAPDADAVVRSISLSSDGTLLYAGGNFTVIGLQSRSNLAALSTTSGVAITSWTPISSAVYATRLSSDDSILYVGGVNELAAFNATDGSAVSSFNPGATVGTVETLEISDDDHMLYLGGGLTSIGGQLRNNIARYDLVGDALTAWDPGADAAVHDLVLSASNTPLYIAGDYTSVGSDDIRTGLTSISMSPPTTSIAPAAGAYSTAQNVTLTCTDNSGAGCAETYYTLDGSSPTSASTPYSTNNPITIPADSAVTVNYFSIDNEGSYETFQTAAFVVDTTAPTTIATPGTGSYNLNDDPISLICTDVGGSGCGATFYTTDGRTPTTVSTLYTGAIPLASLEGTTDLRFFSVDNAGNVELVINSVNYVIDITQPIIGLSLISGTYSPPQTISLICDDGNGSGCDEIYYTTDLSVPTEASTKYSDTGPLTVVSGTTIRAIAVDVAGNFSPEIVGIYAFTIGAGESTNGSGSTDPLLFFLMITGLVIRVWRVKECRH